MPKPNDPTNPDNAPNPPQVPARTKDMDSNLPPGADIEDRFNEFWRQNATSIFGAIALGAVIVIGVQTWQYLQNRGEQQTREAFATAGTREELLSFAQEEDGHPLSGVAYMKIANDDYAAGEYRQAAEHYRMAGERLGGTPLASRAALGAAMSLLLAGDEAAGVDALRAILNNPGYPNGVRTEAGHKLAMQFWEKKDWPAMKQVVDSVLTFDSDLPYRSMTEQIAQGIPELRAAPAQ